jgi:hypothetical protein
MSSPVDGNGKRDDPSAYAPKWVRDSNREGSRENTTFQQSEQSVPEKAPASNQARAHRPLDTASLREAQVAPRARRPLAEGFVREPPPARQVLGRLAALGGLIIAASIGAAIALFVTGKLPSEPNKLLGLSTPRSSSRRRAISTPR